MNYSLLAQEQSVSKIADAVMQSCCSQSVQGIPNWLASASIAAILIFSHIFINSKASFKIKSYWTFNLFEKFPLLLKIVKKNSFPLIIQSLSIFLFLFIIFAGFFGSQRISIVPMLVWTIWWILLIFLAAGFATTFCAICPWEGLSSIISSLSLRSRKKKIGFEMKWPKKLKNVYPALGLFVFLTWLELGIDDMTKSPSMSAIMGLIFLAIAILTVSIFEKRVFCRYLCMVGRISGLYAMFSPLELRGKSMDVCNACTTKDCLRGNEKATGCPTMLFPGGINDNNYCTMCTECVRACPHDNMALNIRSVAADLIHRSRFKMDEAFFAVTLLALTSFHGITMTPSWNIMVDMTRAMTGLSQAPIFSLLMIFMILIPMGIFWFSAWTTKQLTCNHKMRTRDFFKAFAYPLIPVALFYHLAHNGMHFFMEAQNIIPLLSDPMGWGWDLFGTATKTYAPMLSLTSIWYLQVILIVIGHIFGVIVADRIAKVLFKDRKNFIRCLIPQLIVMILYSSFSIWLIAQPMEMRTGM
ncbi:hypothetical protein PQO03_11090 [Lentisphaera profundi]|uniref:4Fe-4S ferredoxin-type domain-containing protein n=1 Tax=Lentisphaera profundi TaxID=1658616 RepID=A0ABY7VTP3_9BACT|nr:hypothetical protein [Lentisphaera profundi]WDE96252.1 hypothetical protein PQO03_11090 [Lentisphaera profundi]